MTWALCFHCGGTKFGAICPCPKCGVASTGDMELDIAFSDHYLSTATLQAFGEVIRAIRRVCEDDQLRFWSFLWYVSTRHPQILRDELSPEQRDRCEEVLARAHPPPVTVEESERARWCRERGERKKGDEATDSASAEGTDSGSS